MDNNVFWDVFRDTGDPMCWLLSRMEATAPTQKTGADCKKTTDGEEGNASSP